MTKLDQYLDAATRTNTRRSYEGAIRHFEIEAGGHLPATADQVARDLAEYADQLSVNTLRQRVAAWRSGTATTVSLTLRECLVLEHQTHAAPLLSLTRDLAIQRAAEFFLHGVVRSKLRAH